MNTAAAAEAARPVSELFPGGFDPDEQPGEGRMFSLDFP
jgi:hypothetical protein